MFDNIPNSEYLYLLKKWIEHYDIDINIKLGQTKIEMAERIDRIISVLKRIERVNEMQKRSKIHKFDIKLRS